MQHFIGCDLHTRYQVVAWVEEETGEIVTRRLEHESGEARTFYTNWPRGTIVGIEATFPALWFERLLGECGHELWVGDAARIRASEVRQQKTDTRDAEHLLDLLRTNRFPRIWVPSVEERDLRQLLVHRMKLVRTRTAVKNQLHALAISQGGVPEGTVVERARASRVGEPSFVALGEPAEAGTVGTARSTASGDRAAE